ncbi:DUF362 domain-containing protein [Methanospirillum stamsii]|uniref:DUF362 domain-containing protein n=1 Tax=Methanospirillum stamsii TaxID=1277351 RepID=A0A2V2N6A8_9EURY|nr:DUF362 domain-containing protein [Methanospirillum stamsii]PWR71767.1 hypothetical protein DLD82_13545 [Methanospirillum stamsii]
MTDYRAYITKISNIQSDITQSLDFINWKDSVQSDSTVFIKPNFTYPFYKEGITTTPLVLKEILGVLKDRADRVIVGESNGGNHSFTADAAFKGHGMPDICRDTGAELVNLSTIPSQYVEEIIVGKRVKVQVPNLLIDDVDCFISVPVLKVHAMTTTTLSMKNLWGCYPDTMRCLHHKYLSRKLTLLTKIINPKLAIIDGTYALNGHGPMYGEAVKSDLLLASNNPVVADTLGTRIMGIPISHVEHIMFAEKEGLGTTKLDNVQFNDGWKQYQMQFKVKKTVLDQFSRILFNSECMAKLVMDSPFKPIIYGIGTKLRNKEEENVSSQISQQ